MLIVYLGLRYDPKLEVQYLEKSKIGLPNAINTFQTNLLDGLRKKNRIIILNTMPIGTYPKNYNQLIFKNEIVFRNETLLEQNIGFINLPIIKQIDRYFNYWKEIKKIVMSTDEQINILAYSMYIPFISAMNKAKKIGNNVKTCLIVPDLPSIYGILPKNPVRRFGYNIYGKSTLKAVEYIDKFVFLTENMDEVINKKKKPFIVIEGVAGTTTYKDEVPTGEKRIILYTGTLKNIYGIKSLIDAFCMIENPNYELWVCGSGETENDLKNLMKVNKRVKYFGFVTKDEVRILQEKAHILVNPRTNDGLYTKYSFPSKTIEYLESGKPVIMHKLSGLPKEYEDYLFLLEDERTETLMKKILEVGAMSNEALFLFGQNAKKWVRETKNADIQASKIVELLLYR